MVQRIEFPRNDCQPDAAGAWGRCGFEPRSRVNSGPDDEDDEDGDDDAPIHA